MNYFDDTQPRLTDGKFASKTVGEPPEGLLTLDSTVFDDDDNTRAYSELDGPPLYDPLLDPDSEVSDAFWQQRELLEPDSEEDRDPVHPEVVTAEDELFEHHFTELVFLGVPREKAYDEARLAARRDLEEETRDAGQNVPDPWAAPPCDNPWLNIDTAGEPPF